MSWFQSRQKQVEHRIHAYCDHVLACSARFQQAMIAQMNQADRQRLAADYLEVHRFENLADDTRREIEVLMYSQALFPESRGDVLGLIETVDRVANHAESAVRMVLNEHIDWPALWTPQMLQLIDTCHRCVSLMIDAVRRLFHNITHAAVGIGRIDELERQADHLEASLIEDVFSSDLDGWRKLHLRDYVHHVSGICDRAQVVGDRIRVIVAKRRA